jgi:hypothetical protein
MIIQVSKSFNDLDFDWKSPKNFDICHSKESDPKPTKAYPTFNFYGTILKQVDEKKTIYSQILNINLGGWISDQKLLKIIAKDRGASIRQHFLNIGKEYPDDAKIEDYKDILCKEEMGEFKNGMGKLLYDLKIQQKRDEYDSKFSHKKRNRREETIKIEEKEKIFNEKSEIE